MINNSRLLLTHSNQQQWPSTFLVNGHRRLSFSFIGIQPKRHPLRRESVLPTTDTPSRGSESSSSWPFQIINMDFHNQTKEIKKNDLFLST